MRPRSKRSKRLKLAFLIVLIGFGIAVYFHFKTQKLVDAPATIQPVTPAARDAARKKYITSIAEAIDKSYKLHGKYPFAVPKTETAICSSSSVHCKQVKLIDLNSLVQDGFLETIPSDPKGGRGQYNSGYSLRHDPDGSMLVLAPRTESQAVLSVKL